MSAPSNISIPLGRQPNGPVRQWFLKSTDHGSTWTDIATGPSLQPGPSGGACEGQSDQELLIWGDGVVTKNGTILFGLRRCRSVSIAVSDDEGASWRYVDIPGSELVSYAFLGFVSFFYDGNVLVPEPISIDAAGNIFAIWVDTHYVLKMSKSTDFMLTWSEPVVISAPVPGDANANMQTYIPTLRHSATPGRGAVVYYGSIDNAVTWNGYIAESDNLLSPNPVFVSVIGNKLSQPLQANKNEKFDSGYVNVFGGDLIEFTDIRYEPRTGNLVAAMTVKMCNAVAAANFDASSCEPGWNYTERASSPWQGIVLSVSH